MIDIDLRSNIKEIERKLSNFAYKQVPFATAQGLTAVARLVTADEKANEAKVLDRPRPFTVNALRVLSAGKSRPYASVVMLDSTAKYLEPYEFGGNNKLNGKALLKPIGAFKDLDQFGNLPRNFMKQLTAREDVFVGTVRSKRGAISGVWQRSSEAGAKVKVTRAGKVRNTRKGLNTSGKLTLLIQFTDAHQARQRLDWFGVARKSVSRNFDREFGKALARAIASAK